MELFHVLKTNVKKIFKVSMFLAGGIYGIMSALLSFISWSELGITSAGIKWIIFWSVLIVSTVASVLWVCLMKRKHKVWERGESRVYVRYGDILKLGFSKRNKTKKIIVFSVNTCFDTIVDEKLSAYAKPLVAADTIHGSWIKKMVENHVSVQEIDKLIEEFLLLKKIVPIRILKQEQKERGKLEEYENGTIAVIERENNVAFFLLALSEFDEDNKAQATKNDVIECVKKTLQYYNANGQG